MKLIPREIPSPRDGGTNAFTALLTPEMRSLLKRSPGVVFQLCNDDGSPHILSRARFNSATQAAQPPYRLMSRAAGRSSERLVWISNDPGYWERLRGKTSKPDGAK